MNGLADSAPALNVPAILRILAHEQAASAFHWKGWISNGQPVPLPADYREASQRLWALAIEETEGGRLDGALASLRAVSRIDSETDAGDAMALAAIEVIALAVRAR